MKVEVEADFHTKLPGYGQEIFIFYVYCREIVQKKFALDFEEFGFGSNWI